MRYLLLWAVALLLTANYTAYAQCGTGNTTDYGSGSWIGYVYNAENNYNYANYQGRVYESQNFNTDFCGGANCTLTTSECSITAEYFTVRYRMTQTFTSSIYRITIGADDGVRLSIDGGSTYIINDYSNHSYRTSYVELHLTGTYNLVLDYYESAVDNRLSFDVTDLGPSWGGTIGSDQDICTTATPDPAAFTSVTPALFEAGGTITYLWQSSTDNATWSDISGTNSTTYDIPSGLAPGIYYYRRSATNGLTTAYSNTVTVRNQQPSGDEVTAGSDSWIGYVYDGANNFVGNYIGALAFSDNFDTSFSGSNTYISTSGCDVRTETFSTRFLMTKTFAYGIYDFTIGADDGVRLSIDGGSTWLIDDYGDHSYRTQTANDVELDGEYDLVLEYYENGGGNRVSFSYVLESLLPVKYLYVKAQPEDNGNLIKWATATEIDNDHFEVERSFDGEAWSYVGQVDGNGNSSAVIKYEFQDFINTSDKPVFYRLKQIDYDGAFQYSEVVVARTGGDLAPAVSVYPNPASESIHVDFPDALVQQINLFTESGRVMKTTTESSLSVTDINPGIYLVEITTPMKVYVSRVIVR